MFRVIALFLVLILPQYALAWGTKEHMMLTRLAAQLVLADPTAPEEMKLWIRETNPDLGDIKKIESYFMNERVGIFPRGADGLAFWVVVPDLMSAGDPPGKKVDGFGVPERLLHYIDLEFFHDDESLRFYKHDLTGLPKVEEVPRDKNDARYARAGMLPFRVEDCYQKLVTQIRANRLGPKPGQFPRDEHALKWAGMLAHYVQDNTQPQHATIDYKSAEYFADKKKAPNVHSQVEYIMSDDENDDYMDLRHEFWPEFMRRVAEQNDPIATTDVWLGTLEVARHSYEALPLIGAAAMHATRQGGTPEAPTGPIEKFDTRAFFRFKGTVRGKEMTVLEMKAQQQAWAVARTVKIWRQAWDEAKRKE